MCNCGQRGGCRNSMFFQFAKDLNDKRGHLSSVCQLYNDLIMMYHECLAEEAREWRERERRACTERKCHLNLKRDKSFATAVPT